MDNKIRYELEFPLNSSPQLLYQYISTPSGLQEWFADNVIQEANSLPLFGMILRKMHVLLLKKQVRRSSSNGSMIPKKIQNIILS